MQSSHECSPYDCVSTFVLLVRHDFHIRDSSRILILAEIIRTVRDQCQRRRRQFLNSNICAWILNDTNISLHRVTFYFFFVSRLYRAYTKRGVWKSARDRVRIATRNCYAQIFDVAYSRTDGSLSASRNIFFSSFPFFHLASPACLPARRFYPNLFLSRARN